MKKLYGLILLIAIAIILVGCSADDGSDIEGVKMKARVTALTEYIEVEVLESEYTFGIHWVITSDETVFVNSNGNTIRRSSLSVGDTLEIIYSGQVMMSYPPKIAARKITVLD